MAQINMSPELQSALLERLKGEFADTAVANFAQDIVIEQLIRDNADLKAHNDALVATNTENRTLIETLRKEREPRGKNALSKS